MIAFAKPDNVIAMPQKSNEWYTPARYVEAAREVMGGIDLDPASCELANRTVRATRYYTMHDNGLLQSWYGRVWLNPPYGKTNDISNMGAFTRRLIAEYQDGHVEQAVLLITTKTCNSWFGLLWNYSICFTDHIIGFNGPERCKKTYNGKYAHIHGTAFVYLGMNNQKFTNVFSEFGPVIPANTAIRRQTVTPLSLWEAQ